VDVIVKEMQQFVTVKDNGIQRVVETEPERAR
jgi:hypothetical protein